MFGRASLSLDELADMIEGVCSRAIIIFGSCSTLDVDARHLKRFLKATDALALCGYRMDVDWMKASAFELLLMSALQNNEFSGRGIDAIERRIAREFGSLARSLKFRMITRKALAKDQ